MLYKVVIHAVDGERFYVAGGPDRAELLAFLKLYDHEGSSVSLEWVATVNEGVPGQTDDAERMYRILVGQEDV